MPFINPVVIDEVVTKQVAALVLTGATTREVAEQLGLGISQVRKIQNSTKFKEVLSAVGDAAVMEAKQAIRAETSRMARKIIKVINEQLDEGNLEAVKIGLKVLGLDQVEEKQQGDTNISVVLPGTVTKDIEVEYASADVSETREGETE